jgi:hypothetical protein
MAVALSDIPDRGARYVDELQRRVASHVRTISLDRLESSLALTGVNPPAVDVKNNPSQVFVGYSLALLI